MKKKANLEEAYARTLKTAVWLDPMLPWKLPVHFEAYANYHKSDIYPYQTRVTLDRSDLKMIAEAAGLYLHRPDKGTGVVVIHRYRSRNDPRQYKHILAQRSINKKSPVKTNKRS
jgi:hypothetical protein